MSDEGKQGQPYEMIVEAGKVREFARAAKSRNPAYFVPAESHPVSPVTFLASSAFWSTPESSPSRGGPPPNWERILHGEQEFVFPNGPPHAGDVLTATTRIGKEYEKEGKRGGTMKFSELITEFRDRDGNLVAESKSTAIETGKATTE
ncbi:MAG: hypothetical protein JWL73_2598 [Actinomycetia bacterium]|nr:hypothetical protein [Actinomycetes bacterium]